MVTFPEKAQAPIFHREIPIHTYHPINVTFFRHHRHCGEAHKSQARELSLKSFSQLRSAFLGANIAEIIAPWPLPVISTNRC
jgi:hypothetical protein